MSRTRNVTPTYISHTQSGRGRLQWYDSLGIRHERLLPGPYGSPQSLEAKARLELEIVTSPTVTAPQVGPVNLSVVELLSAFFTYAERHYRTPDGQPTSEIYEVKIVVRAVRELYGKLPISEFGPMKLKAARQKWVNDHLTRTECNRRVGMVKRIFKWGVSEELVSSPVYQALATVSGLQKGRTEARETDPVGPVVDTIVDATLVHLKRHVRGLVTFQRLTGCRPGEACAIRRCDIDQSGDVWLYKPPHHKTSHRGMSRVVSVGPKAQVLLREFFTDDPTDFLFDPRKEVEEFRAERSANRKTPRHQSHVKYNAKCRVTNPKRRPSARYNRSSYLVAISRACDRTFLPVGELARYEKESVAKWWARLTDEQRDKVNEWRKAHRWSPNQLRHTFATTVRKQHGLEAAQVLLGHSRADVTQVYAEKNEALAATVVRAIG